jgi:hypothetical protein
MDSLKKFSLLFIIMSGFLLLSVQTVYAVVPTFQVASTGNGDSVKIDVTGNQNSQVVLFYLNPNSNIQFVSIGYTDSFGNFSTIIRSSTYNISSNSQVYVSTGGVNGTQSEIITWPSFQTTPVVNTSTFSLSQTGLILNVGQSSTITAGVSSLYLTSNSNSSIANININSNQITVTALAYGSAVVNVCASNSTTNCASFSVTVQNSGTAQLNFSSNNFSISAGQTASVLVSGGSGIYAILNNSNPNAFSANLSGSSVMVSAQASGASGSITVCATNTNICGILNVNSPAVTSVPVSFSIQNPSIVVGQSLTVVIYGASGSGFYIASNSNLNVVQTSINGNNLTLTANSKPGTTEISVCANGSGGCAILNVSVVANAVLVQPVTQVNTQQTVYYNFPRYLGFGDRGDDVFQLQNLLVKLGFLTATPNGRYGPATKLAVQKFQKSHGVRQTGNVGPSTKALLNQIQNTTSTNTTSTTATTLQQQISQLMAQMAQMQGR